MTAQYADGQLAQFIAGNEDGSHNAVTTNLSRSLITGQLGSIESHSSVGATGSLQNLSYGYSLLGEMDLRSDGRNGYSESFTYDAMGRMKSSTVTQGAVVTPRTYTYDDLGNLTARERAVGTAETLALAFPAPGVNALRPHAPVSVTLGTGTAQTFSYDDQGNLTGGYNFTAARVQTLTWTSDNLPKTITEGSDSLTFSYDAGRQRFRQVASLGAGTRTTVYVGGVYEQVTEGSSVTQVHYLKAGSRTVGVYRSDGTAGALRYPLLDHLGSWTALVDEEGEVVVGSESGFDPHGRRREPDGTDVALPYAGTDSTRGYTGHEQLDDMARIHMNGRVYDPDVGIFMSADPVQGLDRYSYVHNSPMNFVDPTGFASTKRLEEVLVDGVRPSANTFVPDMPVIFVNFSDLGSLPSISGTSGQVVLFDPVRGIGAVYDVDKEVDRSGNMHITLKRTNTLIVLPGSTPGFGNSSTPTPPGTYGPGDGGMGGDPFAPQFGEGTQVAECGGCVTQNVMTDALLSDDISLDELRDFYKAQYDGALVGLELDVAIFGSAWSGPHGFLFGRGYLRGGESGLFNGGISLFGLNRNFRIGWSRFGSGEFGSGQTYFSIHGDWIKRIGVTSVHIHLTPGLSDRTVKAMEIWW